MKVERKVFADLSGSEKNEIDQFIDRNGGYVFHYTKFNEIASGMNRTALFYYIAFEGDAMAGICPCHQVTQGLLRFNYSSNGSYEIPYGGWVFNNERTGLESLWNSISPSPFESLTYRTTFNAELPGFLETQATRSETGIIDLTLSADEIWQNCIHSKRRNMIRKAERSGITVRSFGREGMPTYYGLMTEMKSKAGLRETTMDYYDRILEAYAPENAVVMIAYLEGRPVSGTILTGNSNVMHYWQGASSNDGPNLGQGDLLQWESIQWAKKQGSKLYDLCVIEQERLPHIALFKMGFTKDLVNFYCITKKPAVFRIVNKMQKFF